MSESELTKEEIARLIEDSHHPLILDIGAYDGRDSFELRDYFVNCEIHCFEADPRSAELFWFNKKKRKNLRDYTIYLHEKAVGNIDGIVTLHQSDSTTRRHYEDQKSWSASSSLNKPKTHLQLFPDVQFDNTIEVECIKLDTWYETMFEDTIIDFIWCDVNGAEEGVILGGLETMNNCVRYFYCEFSDKELYEGQITKEKLLSLLPEFEEIGVYNWHGNFGNILLKNKNL